MPTQVVYQIPVIVAQACLVSTVDRNLAKAACPCELPVCRGKVANQDAALQELEVVSKIINHLIRKGDTLAVLSRPARQAGEDDSTYLARMQAERVLQLHDNYAPEDE